MLAIGNVSASGSLVCGGHSCFQTPVRRPRTAPCLHPRSYRHQCASGLCHEYTKHKAAYSVNAAVVGNNFTPASSSQGRPPLKNITLITYETKDMSYEC